MYIVFSSFTEDQKHEPLIRNLINTKFYFYTLNCFSIIVWVILLKYPLTISFVGSTKSIAVRLSCHFVPSDNKLKPSKLNKQIRQVWQVKCLSVHKHHSLIFNSWYNPALRTSILMYLSSSVTMHHVISQWKSITPLLMMKVILLLQLILNLLELV